MSTVDSPPPAITRQASEYAVAMPALSSFVDPSTADLLAWSRYMQQIAQRCNVTAPAQMPDNPFIAVGALAMLTEKMTHWLEARLKDEEANLLLLDRLRHEERQQVAHDELMATDDDYASDFNPDGDDDE
jgi:hypothetical protein